MKTLFPAAMIVAMALGCGGGATEPPAPAAEQVVEPAPAAGEVVVARHDLIYSCNCGPDCSCGAVSTKPGKCGCGTDLVEGRMLMIDGSVASLCTCGPDCKCEIGDDPSTCGCGKEMKKVDLAGTGIYYCNCGGSCKCNYVSDQAGRCACGMELKTS
ncbi:MAG: hypothetical protein MUC56_13350 [Thermoanaerobaculales bacterium]|jgi:hypothetical protein|nr:hypothetical protein [Thermoanaerobaculales bacterium]